MPPRWLQHPVTVFLIPLITLLCAPHIYKFLPAGTDPSYNEAKLQRIASLMDDVYTVLANSTFIPHNAIQRAPHHVNTTAPACKPYGPQCTALFGTNVQLKCKPSASVLRLMELLPYVDSTLVLEPDWIYGGHFMDYRKPEHLAELCDPLRGEYIGWADYMLPSDIALTNWGTGGWNNDRTWVLIYNTERDAIRIFEAELWLERSQAQDEFGEEMNNWWFEDNGEFVWDRADGASHILRAIANNYRKLRRTPWEMSNRDGTQTPADRPLSTRVDPYGLDDDYLRDAMKRNGWPHVFDPTKFNAELIRTQHMPRRQTMTEAIQAHINSIDREKAQIEERIAHHRTRLEKAKTEDQRWLERWRIQQLEWDVEDKAVDLAEVEQVKAEMCPNDLCKPNPAPALWQQWALSHMLQEAESTNHTESCDRRLHDFEELDAKMYRNSSYRTPSRIEACIDNEKAKLPYIRQAYEDSTADALKLCEESGCTLLSEEDVWGRARLMANHRRERGNAGDRSRLTKSLFFRSHVSQDTKAALADINKFISSVEYGVKWRMKRVDHIEGLIDQAKKGGSELYNLLVHINQISGPEEHEDDGWTKGAWKEYNKWTWLRQVQKQTEKGDSVQDSEQMPETIDATTQIEIDRIRAQHEPLGKQHAKAAYNPIDDLLGYNRTITKDNATTNDSYKGSIYLTQQSLLRHREALETAADDEEKALYEWRIQRTLWEISDLEASLSVAQAEFARLCPDNICVNPEHAIVWELRTLQHILEEMHYTDFPEACERHLSDEKTDRYAKMNECIANKVAERHYLQLAAAQCRVEAEAHCNKTGCKLLPFEDVFARAQIKVAEIERKIKANENRLERMDEEAKKNEKLVYVDEKSVAAMEFNRDVSLVAHENWFWRDEIERITEMVGKLKKGELDGGERKWLFQYLRGEDDDIDWRM